jgi:hypothetical protein
VGGGTSTGGYLPAVVGKTYYNGPWEDGYGFKCISETAVDGVYMWQGPFGDTQIHERWSHLKEKDELLLASIAKAEQQIERMRSMLDASA